jgi:hypothetical protein
MQKLTLLILFSIACSVVGCGQKPRTAKSISDSLCSRYPDALTGAAVYIDTFAWSYDGRVWIKMTKAKAQAFCERVYADPHNYPVPSGNSLQSYFGQSATDGNSLQAYFGQSSGQDTIPLPKPKKPVKKKVDTAHNTSFGMSHMKDNTTGTYSSMPLSNYPGNPGIAYDPPYATVEEPYNPIPDILKRLDILEKQYQFLVRRTIEMQIEIDSLKPKSPKPGHKWEDAFLPNYQPYEIFIDSNGRRAVGRNKAGLIWVPITATYLDTHPVNNQ